MVRAHVTDHGCVRWEWSRDAWHLVLGPSRGFVGAWLVGVGRPCLALTVEGSRWRGRVLPGERERPLGQSVEVGRVAGQGLRRVVPQSPVWGLGHDRARRVLSER